MPLKDIKDFLNRDVTEVFGRRSAPARPEAATCADAFFQVRPQDDRLALLCTTPRLVLLTVAAQLTGALTMSRTTGPDRVPCIRVSVPVEAGGRPLNIELLYSGDACAPSFELRRAACQEASEAARTYEFVLGDVRERTSFRISIPRTMEVGDFTPREPEAAPARPATPSVSQLAAVLRATLEQRRDCVSIMEDLGQSLSPETMQRVALLRSRLPARPFLTSTPLQWLQEHLREGRRAFHGPTLAALCMLLDMEAGRLTDADVEDLALGRSPLQTSWEALRMVASFDGVTLDRDAWKQRYEAAGLTFPQRADSAIFERMTTALALIEDRMQAHDARQVLSSLQRESPSPRVTAVMERWRQMPASRAAVPDPVKVHGFAAFHALMSAMGARLGPGTLLAFCLYAEIECGRLDADSFAGWLEAATPLNLSPYAMRVIAEALDVELLALSLPGEGTPLLHAVRTLLAHAPGGILLGLETDHGSEAVYHHVAPGSRPQDALSKGWRPSGDVLFRAAMLDQVGADDLGLFLARGASFFACFQSDVDRRRVWKLLTPDNASALSRGTFLDGFRVYHFQGRILASLESAPIDDTSDEPRIYRDDRGRLHFVAPDVPVAAHLERQPLRVAFPSVAALADNLTEMGAEKLVGRFDAAPGDARKLELLSQAVRKLTERKEVPGPSLTDRGLRAIAQNLEAPRVMQILRPVVDSRTLDHIRTIFLDPEKTPLDYHLYEPILQGLRHLEILDFVTIALVYELCLSNQTAGMTFHKSFDRTWFRAALRNQLLLAVEADDALVRQLGCMLLSTGSCTADPSERMIVEYELQKRLESAQRSEAQEAACSLVRLALEPGRPLPRLWHLQPRPVATKRTASPTREGPPVVQVMGEIREWHARVSGLLGLAGVAQQRGPTPTAAPGATSGPLLDLARVIAGARHAFTEEQRGGSNLSNATVVLTTDGVLREILQGLLDSWQEHADCTHRAVRDAVTDVASAEGMQGYVAFVSGQPEWAARLWPLSGANAAPVLPRRRRELAAWPFAEVSDPAPFWIQREGFEGWSVSPFFMDLLHKAMEHGVDALRLCRVRPAEDGRPDAFVMDTYSLHQGAFAPFLEEMRIPAQFFLSVRDQDVLGTLVTQIEKAAQAPADAATLPIRKSRDKRPPAREAGEVERMAAALLEAFQLPPSYSPQVMKILTS